MISTSQHIQTIQSVQDAALILDKATTDTWVLLDVDDTLITPSDKIFRYAQGQNPDHLLVDSYKNQHKTDGDKVVSQWRLERPIQLVENAWPQIIKALHARDTPVFALTFLPIGSCGDIASMEQWRADELAQHELRFTNIEPAEQPLPLTGASGKKGSFYKGMLMTGPLKKAELLHAFIKYRGTKPKKIIFFDDREGHVEALGEYCAQENIAYTGYIYQAAKFLPGVPDPHIAALQKKTFLEDGYWLSDAVAKRILTAKVPSEF